MLMKTKAATVEDAGTNTTKVVDVPPYWVPERIDPNKAMQGTTSPAALKPTDFELYRLYKLNQLGGKDAEQVVAANLKNSRTVSPLSMERSSRLSNM